MAITCQRAAADIFLSSTRLHPIILTPPRECKMECNLIGWCSLPLEAQAAWVQAVFSIVGIGVAIAIPGIQHLRDRRDKELQEIKEAKALALLLLPTLDTWIENISSYQHVVRQHLDAHFPGSIDWSSVANALVLGEQGKILAPKSHLMGPVAHDAQQFFYLLACARQIALYRGSKRSGRDEDRTHIESVTEMIEKAKLAALRAQDAAHHLFDAR